MEQPSPRSHSHSVLLKLNPVNEYLEPIFNRAFAPLIDANLLRVVRGGGDTGKAIVDHHDIDSIHITGSHITHEGIVWGFDADSREKLRAANKPLVTKTVTSELGNVTPWIIVPGKYSRRQLKSQAEHLIASITNNVSFNCLSTKVIVTSSNWAQRTEFLDLVDSLLLKVPQRFAYYPGAKERFEQATTSGHIGHFQTKRPARFSSWNHHRENVFLSRRLKQFEIQASIGRNANHGTPTRRLGRHPVSVERRTDPSPAGDCWRFG